MNIDIHSHIIPFVDDGSSKLEDSFAMLKDEVEQGITKVICTPHYIVGRYKKTNEEIEENFKLLTDYVKENNLPIELRLGREIHYTNRVDLIKLIESETIRTLNKTNLVLLEFSYDHAPEDTLNEILYRFDIHGYKVVLAHVERYKWMKIDDIKIAKKTGALIQVNANALNGKDGLKLALLSRKLVKLGLVDYIASDVHSFRENTLRKALDKYGDLVSNEDIGD